MRSPKKTTKGDFIRQFEAVNAVKAAVAAKAVEDAKRAVQEAREAKAKAARDAQLAKARSAEARTKAAKAKAMAAEATKEAKEAKAEATKEEKAKEAEESRRRCLVKETAASLCGALERLGKKSASKEWIVSFSNDRVSIAFAPSGREFASVSEAVAYHGDPQGAVADLTSRFSEMLASSDLQNKDRFSPAQWSVEYWEGKGFVYEHRPSQLAFHDPSSAVEFAKDGFTDEDEANRAQLRDLLSALNQAKEMSRRCLSKTQQQHHRPLDTPASVAPRDGDETPSTRSRGAPPQVTLMIHDGEEDGEDDDVNDDNYRVPEEDEEDEEDEGEGEDEEMEFDP